MTAATDTTQTHLEPTGREPRPCDTCGTVFTPKRRWSRFCKTKCRNDHHAAQAREEAKRAAAPEMYAALLATRHTIAGKDVEQVWINYPTEPAVSLGQYLDKVLAKAGYREPKPVKPKAEAPA